MGFWDSLRNTFGGETEAEEEFNSEYDEEVREEEKKPAVSSAKAAGSVSGPASLEMKLCKPSRFDEVAGIATHLLEHKTVVLNLENTNRETAIRIIDFLSGVTFAIKGQLKTVASSTYVITPDHVEVTGEQKQEEGTLTEAPTGGRKPRELF